MSTSPLFTSLFLLVKIGSLSLCFVSGFASAFLSPVWAPHLLIYPTIKTHPSSPSPFPLLPPLQDRLDHLTNHVMDVSQRTHDRTHLMSFVLRFYTLTVTSQATSVPTLVRHDPKSNIYRTCLCFYDPPPTLVLKALPPPTTHSIGDLDVLHSPYKDFSWYST